MGFNMTPVMKGRPSYHPSLMIRLYIYGYLNFIQSSRRLEREVNRNVELMCFWAALLQISNDIRFS
ncbi:MAG: transposase [Kangiellaceae bacterium]|nr:transposase [Kangiellaceae bacterium]